ncbi:MAG: PAS domain S-box protein [Deltaproteobacteria bacterium]|nr:PAS domain S-box protein [Deltaproteobacteria bacterium]
MSSKDSDRLISVLDAMEDGIYIVSRDYTVEFMNRVMIEQFGYGIGKKCYEVINRDNRICSWCGSGEVFDKGETRRSELILPDTDRIYELIELPLRNTDGSLSKVAIYRNITKRKKREEKLWKTEADYRRLFEHVGCGVYISSKEGKFIDANPALLKMLGYESKEEFLKIDITKDLYLKPEDRRRFQAMIERDGQVINYEVDFKRKDGSRIPVLLTSHVRCNRQGEVVGYEGIIVDQSERKQIEEDYKSLFEHMPTGVFISSKEGKFINANKALLDMLGYDSKEEFLKIDITKDLYVRPEDRQKFREMIERDGRVIEYEVEFKRKDGTPIPILLTAHARYDQQGNIVGYEGLNVDQTQRKQMEKKLRQTQEQLLNSEKLAAMGRLTSQIAHELNNPLYGIMNTLELLKTEIPSQNKRRKILEMALSETIRLSDLLKKMLSFSKPDQEEKQVVDINRILDEILLLHEKQFRENDIRIVSSFAEDLGKVHASINQLRQVFLNIVSNAKDAMPSGGTLTVKTSSRNGIIQIDISDTGIGISAENMNRIFDAFFTTKESVKGVGLGLSVCYQFIKYHGGDISVTSQPNVGTTFTITLPEYKEAESPVYATSFV